MIRRITAWPATWRCLGQDRGDSPVPSAIIIAGLAVIAVALLVWVFGMANDFMGEAPTKLPAVGGDD